MTPFASVVSTCDGVWYKLVEPFAAMEKYTSALLVEATWKSGRFVVVVAWTAKDANGVDVPTPTRWPPASVMARRSVDEVAHLLGEFEVLPPPVPAHSPLGNLKQPLVSWMPFANVEVAAP